MTSPCRGCPVEVTRFGCNCAEVLPRDENAGLSVNFSSRQRSGARIQLGSCPFGFFRGFTSRASVSSVCLAALPGELSPCVSPEPMYQIPECKECSAAAPPSEIAIRESTGRSCS